MTALAQDIVLVESVGPKGDFPMAASALVYQGSIVGLNSSGYARPFVLGDRFVGHAFRGWDNTGGADGVEFVRTFRGRYYLSIAGLGAVLADAIKQSPVYAQDSGGLSLRNGQMVGRVVEYVDSNTCIVEFDAALQVQVLSQRAQLASFTDGGSTAGTYDLPVVVPKGSLVLGWEANVVAGFAGDTSATLQVGVSGTLDRFSAVTTGSVFAAGVIGSAAQQIAAKQGYCSADTTVRLTVTSGADFTSVNAGDMDVRMLYVPTLRA